MRVWVVSLLQLELSPQPLTALINTKVFGVWLSINHCCSIFIQCSTPLVYIKTLYLNIFRGEPAISGHAKHITPPHRSSQPFAAGTGSGLPQIFIWVHPVHGQLARFRVFLYQLNRPFKARFHYGCATKWLNLILTERNSPVHSSIGTILVRLNRTSICLLANNFRYYFTGSLTLLFTFPSRYQFTIGIFGYLALERGRPRFPLEFAVSCGTQESSKAVSNFKYKAFTFFGCLFQNILLLSTVLY